MWLGNSHFLEVFQLVIACVIVRWLAGFKCFQNHQVNLGTRVFTGSWLVVMWFRLCLVTRLVTSLVTFADVLMTLSLGSADLIMSFDWLQPLFEFVLAVSGYRTFQQACFLYSNKVVAGNLPLTFFKLYNFSRYQKLISQFNNFNTSWDPWECLSLSITVKYLF